MQDNRFIFRSFGLFFRFRPIRLITLFLISLFLGFCQGFTIVLLIPLLGLLDPALQNSSSGNSLVASLNLVFRDNGIGVNLGLILIIYTLTLVFIALLNYAQMLMQSSYQQGFSYNIRKLLFKKIINSDWQYLNGKSKHNHIQVLTTEVPKMTTYYYYYLSLAGKVIFALSHVILAMTISAKFTLFTIAAGSVVFFILRKNIRRSSVLGSETITASRKMLKSIDDFWVTVKIAKVHNSEKFYFRKFDETNKKMLDNQTKLLKNRSLPQLLFSIAGVISLIIVVYFAYEVVSIPLSTLIILILLFARIFPQFSGINADLNMLVANTKSVKMVIGMDRELEDRPFDQCMSKETIIYDNSLNINNLNFAYNHEHPLFENFSASFPARKITGVIGKSGCGKTTLMDIIAGLLKSSDTTITVDGNVLSADKLPSWKREIGYLPQDAFFIDGSIRENLVWDSTQQLSDDQIFEILKQIDAYNLVMSQKDGIDTYVANYQYHFSGGERQRLALARVLIRKPKLLLLDEATSSLDSKSEAQIMDCLTRLKKDVTIIFVTHRTSLTPYFDKIVDLDTTTPCHSFLQVGV